MLQFHNTLNRKKTPFVPLVPGKVSLYVCGITVYDYCHIGHARTAICFDVLVRYLRFQGYDVCYVRNITDIDDKIINRAASEQEDFRALTARFSKAMHEDYHALGLLTPTHEPRATEAMDHIIALVQTLLDKGFAYISASGDVYYDIAKLPDYGLLAHQDLASLMAGARVEVAKDKHNSLDFVLWKVAKPGEPSWDSPWGKGRPGWHIECSAMSIHALGNTFDIHGGGQDLCFPHHENERAQSSAATGECFVHTWMHVGFVQVADEKMSKSLGNFFTIRDVLRYFDGETIRYFLLSSHYRSPINYTNASLSQAHASLATLYTALRDSEDAETDASTWQDNPYYRAFLDKMDDDLNTPEALSVLFEIAHNINRLKTKDKAAAQQLASMLRHLGQVLGILGQTPTDFLQSSQQTLNRDRVEALIKQRKQARQAKDWAKADSIRDELDSLGVAIEDTAQGTIWRVKS